jgi:hypothetical protein
MVKRWKNAVSRRLGNVNHHSYLSSSGLLSHMNSDVGKTEQEDIVFRVCSPEKAGQSILNKADEAALTAHEELVPPVLISQLNFNRFQTQVWEVHNCSSLFI